MRTVRNRVEQKGYGLRFGEEGSLGTSRDGGGVKSPKGQKNWSQRNAKKTRPVV